MKIINHFITNYQSDNDFYTDTMSEGKCPVDQKTRDLWIQKSKEAQHSKEFQNALNQSNTLSNQSNEWSWKNILWSSTPKPDISQQINIPQHPKVTPSTGLRKTLNEPEAIECTSDNLDQSLETPSNATLGEGLSLEREISSIPRTSENGNWVYPSEKQFFNAMKRKNWEPEEKDMKTVVPLHNQVNEIAWRYIQQWERGQGGDKCGGIKLSSFKGDAKKITPRAAINHYIFGKELPFDRHDWKVNRCGVEIDYVIDFYTTKVNEGEEPRFFLDVRPKLNTFEGIRMRIFRAFGM